MIAHAGLFVVTTTKADAMPLRRCHCSSCAEQGDATTLLEQSRQETDWDATNVLIILKLGYHKNECLDMLLHSGT